MLKNLKNNRLAAKEGRRRLQVIGGQINQLRITLEGLQANFESLPQFEDELDFAKKAIERSLNSAERNLRGVVIKKKNISIGIFEEPSQNTLDMLESLESSILSLEKDTQSIHFNIQSMLETAQEFKRSISLIEEQKKKLFLDICEFANANGYTLQELKNDAEVITTELEELSSLNLASKKKLKSMVRRIQNLHDDFHCFQKGISAPAEFEVLIQKTEKEAREYLKKEKLMNFHFDVEDFEKIKRISNYLNDYMRSEKINSVQYVINQVPRMCAQFLKNLELLTQMRWQNQFLIDTFQEEIENRKGSKVQDTDKLNIILKNVSENYIASEAIHILSGFSKAYEVLEEIEVLLQSVIVHQKAQYFSESRSRLLQIEKKFQEANQMKNATFNILDYFEEIKQQEEECLHQTNDMLETIALNASNANIQKPSTIQVEKKMKKAYLLLRESPLNLDELRNISSEVFKEASVINEQLIVSIKRKEELERQLEHYTALHKNKFSRVYGNDSSVLPKYPDNHKDSEVYSMLHTCNFALVETYIAELSNEVKELDAQCKPSRVIEDSYPRSLHNNFNYYRGDDNNHSKDYGNYSNDFNTFSNNYNDDRDTGGSWSSND